MLAWGSQRHWNDMDGCARRETAGACREHGKGTVRLGYNTRKYCTPITFSPFSSSLTCWGLWQAQSQPSTKKIWKSWKNSQKTLDKKARWDDLTQHCETKDLVIVSFLSMFCLKIFVPEVLGILLYMGMFTALITTQRVDDLVLFYIHDSSMYYSKA